MPLYVRAVAVFTHADNSHLVSTFVEPAWEQVLGIDVGFYIGSTSGDTLATLGRSAADITVEGSNI